MERILLNRLIVFSIQKKLFNKNHHGFLPRRDCMVSILTLHADIIKAHQEKEFFCLIALDIKSAYDSVWIDGLMLKLLQVGITGRMALYISG